MGMDNRVSPDPPGYTVTVHKPVDTHGEFACISCNSYFWVYTGPLGIQTLFCGECINHLKSAIQREKTKDFGW